MRRCRLGVLRTLETAGTVLTSLVSVEQLAARAASGPGRSKGGKSASETLGTNAGLTSAINQLIVLFRLVVQVLLNSHKVNLPHFVLRRVEAAGLRVIQGRSCLGVLVQLDHFH